MNVKYVGLLQMLLQLYSLSCNTRLPGLAALNKPYTRFQRIHDKVDLTGSAKTRAYVQHRVPLIRIKRP